MKRFHVAFVALFAIFAVACAALAPAVVAAERATCVELRAESPSGAVDAVCAGADELAPYVADIIATQARKPMAARLAKPSASMTVIALPPPSHPVERRRCTVWEHLPDPPDGGSDAAH